MTIPATGQTQWQVLPMNAEIAWRPPPNNPSGTAVASAGEASGARTGSGDSGGSSAADQWAAANAVDLIA